MITEHLGTPTTHCLIPSWWQRAVFLPHGTWLHDVHHINQNVPFHHLEEALVYYPTLADRKTVGELFEGFSRSDPASSEGLLSGVVRSDVGAAHGPTDFTRRRSKRSKAAR
jgi:fatty acid desaturase